MTKSLGNRKFLKSDVVCLLQGDSAAFCHFIPAWTAYECYLLVSVGLSITLYCVCVCVCVSVSKSS